MKCFIDLLQKQRDTVMWPTKRKKPQNKYKLVLCVDKKRKRTRENKNNIYIYTYIYTLRKKNTRWVTVLPIWTGMCLLLEVKGQRATFNSAIFHG